MMKRYTMKLIGMLMLLLSLSACKNGEATTVNQLPKEVKIGIIRVPNDKQVAISTQKFDQYFKDKGIETEFLFFDSGVAANQALVSGSIDFAEMGYTNGVVALAKKLPVELIWLHDVIGENEALVVPENSKVQSVADLKGKKIAVPFSSTSHFSLLKALEEAGIREEVSLLDMETADIVAAWERNDLDAAYTWEPTLSHLKDQGRVLLTSRDLAEKGYMTSNIDLVHKDFAKKYPELVVDYLSALTDGQNVYFEEPAKAVAQVSKDLNLTEEETLKQMNMSQWLRPEELISNDYLGTNAKPGHFHQVFLDTAEFLVEQKSIDQIPSEQEVNEFINSEYIEKLIERK
ncbi:taurine ABC transporter substrate-binding protein [Enterococcus eurekensis]|uniref:MetQ/NlpA family ABC transporter substrate-binding protein n=1 Tax=Enterococcus eurekensis TaxID=1159753 RepID=A0ABV9M1R3_9ENTE